MKRVGIFVAIGLVAVTAGLYCIHPLAPLFLLLSILIQAPLIWQLVRVNFTSSYRDRAFARRETFLQDGDAAVWLAAEEKEAANPGFRYWSRGGRALNALNRADALAALGRRDEAAALLGALEATKLDSTAKPRYTALRRQLAQDTGQTKEEAPQAGQ